MPAQRPPYRICRAREKRGVVLDNCGAVRVLEVNKMAPPSQRRGSLCIDVHVVPDDFWLHKKGPRL